MTLDDFNKQAKKEERRRKFKEATDNFRQKAGNVANEIYRNRYAIAGTIFAGVTVARSVNKLVNDGRDRKRADRMIYDRKTDDWWETKRKLTNNERIQMLEIMKSRGCGKGEALRIMGLLRR